MLMRSVSFFLFRYCCYGPVVHIQFVHIRFVQRTRMPETSDINNISESCQILLKGGRDQMFCTECGKALEDDEKVCRVCGKVLTEDIPESLMQAEETQEEAKGETQEEAKGETQEATTQERLPENGSVSQAGSAPGKIIISDSLQLIIVAVLTIINMYLLRIFAIGSVILIILALSSKTQEDAERMVRYAKWCGIAGIIMFIVCVILLVVIIGFYSVSSVESVSPS